VCSIYLPHAASLADEIAGAKTDLTDVDATAVRVVAGSLNHLAVTDIDSNVVDRGSRGAEEDKITAVEAADVNEVAAAAVLTLGGVSDGLAGALVDRVLGETAAIEAHDVAIIAVGSLVLLDTVGGTVVVSATPAVGIGTNHALSSRGDTVTVSAHSNSDKSKSKSKKETHCSY